MAREALKNVGASVRARLLQRSRDERTDFQILLTRYALERLLYRLSQSEHRNRFILMGVMLFVTWVEAPFQPTRDLDLLGYGENSPEAIGNAFRAIFNEPVDDDGVVFDVDGLEATPIREDIEYGGVGGGKGGGMRSLRAPSRSTIRRCSMRRRRVCARIRSRQWLPRSSMPLRPAASQTAG
jgi:hypothetical protein